MAIIDRVYRTVQHLTNIENRGYLTPDEFNNFAHLAQNEIIEQYFTDYSFYENAKKVGKGNAENADLAKHFQEKINRLSQVETLTGLIGGIAVIPDSLYRLTHVTAAGIPVEEEHHMHNSYAELSPLARATTSRPTYLRRKVDGIDSIAILPATITEVVLDYIGKPGIPKWTYTSVGGNALFNSAAFDFQDFSVHPSDEAEITIKILGYTGISIRDAEVIQSAQAEMAQDFQKENRI